MVRKLPLQPARNTKGRFFALCACVCLVSALSAFLIDIDHLFYYLGWISDGRAFHPYLILVGSVFIFCGGVITLTLLCRLYRKARVLRLDSGNDSS